MSDKAVGTTRGGGGSIYPTQDFELKMTWRYFQFGQILKQIREMTFLFYLPTPIGCVIIIWTGLNIKIGIAQKVYELWNCSFVKILPWWDNDFGKRTVS